MVAYSFQPRFVDPILVGLGREQHVHRLGPLPRPKRQTIRADRKRHARAGEEIQLYTGMRTKQCCLIGKARCTGVSRIRIHFDRLYPRIFIGAHLQLYPRRLLDFAHADGFESWKEFVAFWREHHEPIFARRGPCFNGVLISWEPIDDA